MTTHNTLSGPEYVNQPGYKEDCERYIRKEELNKEIGFYLWVFLMVSILCLWVDAIIHKPNTKAELINRPTACPCSQGESR